MGQGGMRWGFITPGEGGTHGSVVFMQSADPADLESRIQSFLDSFPDDHSTRVVAMELAGAGEGAIFTVRAEHGPAADVVDWSPAGPPDGIGGPGGFACPEPVQIVPAVYMGDNADELWNARDRWLADHPTLSADYMVIGTALAGGTQTRRICALDIWGLKTLYTPASSPVP